jgi:hypothetical protein
MTGSEAPEDKVSEKVQKPECEHKFVFTHETKTSDDRYILEWQCKHCRKSLTIDSKHPYDLDEYN